MGKKPDVGQVQAAGQRVAQIFPKDFGGQNEHPLPLEALLFHQTLFHGLIVASLWNIVHLCIRKDIPFPPAKR